MDETITRERITLRHFREDDCEEVTRLAGDAAIADTTVNVPHPYLTKMAVQWISSHAKERNRGSNFVFAIENHSTGQLLGAINLAVSKRDNKGEIGYWIGREFWGRGYATEATLAMLDLGFGSLGLHRILGRCFVRNPASGRVLEKAGMQCEGVAREDVLKNGVYEDFATFGILRQEWESEHRSG